MTSDPTEPSGPGASQRESGRSFFGPLALVVCAIAIFCSAYLLFLVQPMVGKRILPWFGGVPAVWSVCLAFYQSMLFLGYAYAHGMIRIVPARLQPWIHALLLVGAIGSLPILPTTPPPAGEMVDPVSSVLRILLSDVALPFAALASTGPLVQAWFARTQPTRSPYPLYAVSNLGSLAALVSFPFVLEPRFSLTELGHALGVGLVVTSAAILLSALPVALLGAEKTRSLRPPSMQATLRPAIFDRVLWLLLSATAVVLLMGVTNELCLDVASIPFLWILPLAVYLVTFIVAFSTERAYHRPTFVILAIGALASAKFLTIDTLIVYQVTAYCVLLFAVCMILHGELYRSRPGPESLTAFYLFVSAGGALGGLFVGIVAPLVFDDYSELQVGLIATACLIAWILAGDAGRTLPAIRPAWQRLVASMLAAVLVGFVVFHEPPSKTRVVHRERSFFGVLSVTRPESEAVQLLSLMNGTTLHGIQFQAAADRRVPTAYYGRATGLGLALTSRPAHGESRIGVIGLGVGTLAAYGREGDQIRFYEIDPGVVRLAGPGGSFSFISDSSADVEIVVGDARRSIEDEQDRGEPQRFDFLVLDAFSSDSIPVHLMTREAFERYFRALAPGGLMAVHVSNRHFELMGLVSRIANELGAHSLQIQTPPIPQMNSGLSEWVILGRDSDQLTRLNVRIEKRHRLLGLPAETLMIQRGVFTRKDVFPLWTDDYSDLLRVIRWN